VSAEDDRYEDLPDGAPEDLDIEVDVDLDAMGDEATGEPTKVRLDGKIIYIQHASDWNSTAMRAAASGDWDTWAREVIDDDDQYKTWEEADLRNSQVEAVFVQCGRQARMSAGKSQRRGGSRRGTRRR
jgi:hypothetical protein